MKKIKPLLNIITYNFDTLITFELSFKLLLSLIFIPLIYYLLNVSLNISGYTYLTIENLLTFLLNPFTVFTFLLIIILLTIVSLFDITSLIILYNKSYEKEKIDTFNLIKLSFFKCKKFIRFKNISIIFLLLFLIPFMNISLSSNVITSIKLPEFIMDFILDNKILLCIYTLIYIFLFILLSRWLYSIFYMILEDKNFKEARKLSKNMSKSNIIKDNVIIFLTQISLTLLFIIFLVLGIVVIYLLYYLLSKLVIIKSLLITVVWVFLFIFIFITSIISNSISYAIVSLLFYKHKNEYNEKICFIDSTQSKKSKSKTKYIIIYIVLVIISSFLTFNIVTGNYDFDILLNRNIDVTAHRGASALYPENTMSAFKGAKELNATYIELDVQQTKDGEIVVSHDTNLLRVAGINKNIIDMTYDEIKEIDIGSFFDSKYSFERMPLLKDVIEYAKENNIKLNIELKPVGLEKDFEKSVIDIIKSYNYESKSIITSQVYDVLKNIKDYTSDIETVYVMSIAAGNLLDLTYADSFSIEASNVYEEMVNMIHNANKKIYVWTVNESDTINEMINLGVDNIITDDVTLVKDLIESSKQSNIVKEILKLLGN